MHVQFSAKKSSKSQILVVPVLAGGKLATDQVSSEIANQAAHNIQSDAKFKGKTGQTLTFAAPEESSYKKVILLGMGDSGLRKATYRAAGRPLYKAIEATGYENADIIPAQTQKMKISTAKGAANLADAVNAASYSFDKYITDERASETRPAKLNVIVDDVKGAKAAYAPLAEVTEGEFLAANMGNEPGNVFNPATAPELIKSELGHLPGIKIKVIDTPEMEKENMNAALAVGQGSNTPPCMVVIEYDGTNGATKDWPLALVGKGVTFDSGGISLKPGAGMDEMKMDMCGAAAVVGAMRALAGRQANTKVVAICGFAENMPDGKSCRPGDIIKTRSGKTVNIGNTDAEGRLVLCDALDYIQDKYKPGTMVDLATLTGAVLVSLAHTYSGVFTPENKLWKKLEKSGNKSGQPGWRLPLHEDFAKAVKGKVTDLENSAKMRWAGSSTAAEFLKSFVKAATNWAHLDIAGTAIPASGKANGHGVRWLDRFIADNFELSGKKAAPSAPKAAP